MPEPQRTDEPSAQPTGPGQETTSSLGDPTAGFAEEAGGEESLAFLGKAPGPDELGRLAHYRVLKELGRGGMGCVLLAEDTKLERKVALKVMLPQHARNPMARERFLREARSAAKIKHDHVITIHQVDEANGVPFIALEFLEGTPLDKYLNNKGALPLPVAVRIAQEMAEGLHTAHKHGLIHRDIKPGNVWLEALPASPGRESGSFRVKLLDFGLARVEQEDTHLTASGAIVGTPAFMAPEQARGEKVDARSDLWSLGVVLYRLCTGKQPFAGPTAMSVLTSIAIDSPPPPRSINPDIPNALERIIQRLLEKDPAKRYASAQDVISDLNSVARTLASDRTGSAGDGAWTQTGPLPEVAATVSLPALSLRGRGAGGEGPRPRRRWPLLLGLSAVLLLLLAGGIAFLMSRERQPADSARSQAQKPISSDLPQMLPPTFTNSLGMEFVLVPKGKFWMGGISGNVGTKEVEIPYDFYLGKYEVTQEEWEKVTGLNPSHFCRTGGQKNAVKGIADGELKRFPVEQVSWDDCQAFVKLMNERAKEAGWLYRLPTEAEWEYACRGGPASNKFDYGFNFYLEKPSLQLQPDQANFNHVLKRTCKVGSYQPNKLGLFDMHGNVSEWCGDEMKDDKGASQRVNRGGSWGRDRGHCLAALRGVLTPSNCNDNLGLRLARVPVNAGGK